MENEKINEFREDVKSLNLSDKKLKEVVNVVKNEYHNENKPDPEQLNQAIKMILGILRISYYSKMKNLSDDFLTKMMDVDLERTKFIEVLGVVKKHYHSKPKR